MVPMNFAGHGFMLRRRLAGLRPELRADGEVTQRLPSLRGLIVMPLVWIHLVGAVVVAAALVIFANVGIWVVPDEKGQSLVTGAAEQP